MHDSCLQQSKLKNEAMRNGKEMIGHEFSQELGTDVAISLIAKNMCFRCC